MSNRQFDTRAETKPSLSRQPVRRREQGHVAETSIFPERDPLPRAINSAGNLLSASTHASMLNRATAGRPSRAGQSLLQLQRQYGNRYVQRVLALARKRTGEAKAAPDVERAIQRVRGGGQALDSGARTQMESSFGADFSGVRVHTDGEADTLNRQLSARAFTTGQDIFFRQGAYNPGSSSGRELLAHELTHAVQQNSNKIQCKLTVGRPGDKYEQEADQVARAVMQQEQQPVQRETDEGVVVRRQVEEEEEEPVQAKAEESCIQRQAEEEEEEPLQTREDNTLVQRQVEVPEEEEEPVQAKAESAWIQRQVKDEEEPIQIKAEEGFAQRLMRGEKQRFESAGILKAEGKKKTPAEEGKATMEPPWTKELCKKWKKEELKSGLPGFTKKYVEAKYSHCEDVVSRWDTHYGKWEGTLDKNQQWFFWEYGKSFARPEVKGQEYWKNNLWQRFYMSRRYAPSVREKAKQVL